jgi:hypothetical protein
MTLEPWPAAAPLVALGVAPETLRRIAMQFLKRVLSTPLLKRVMAVPHLKYGLLALGSGAWVVGLVDQLYSSAAAMKYLLMSLLMVAVAIL